MVQMVQKTIAVPTGRRLALVRMFTSDRDLPDLTSLRFFRTVPSRLLIVIPGTAPTSYRRGLTRIKPAAALAS
jgi:hypothetical protein